MSPSGIAPPSPFSDTGEFGVQGQDLFLALFQQSREPLYLLDGEARLVIANPAGEALAGYSSAELRDLDTAETVSRAGRPFQRDDLSARLHALPRGHAEVLEVEHRRRGGEVIPLELTMRRFDHSGHILFFVAALDISARKAEDAARRRRAARDELMLSVTKRFVREPLETAAAASIADIAAFLDLEAMIVRDAPDAGEAADIRAGWYRAPETARRLSDMLGGWTDARQEGDGAVICWQGVGHSGDQTGYLLLAAPVIGESGIEAEVIMARPGGPDAVWGEEDRRLLAVLCEVYALALSRLRERTARADSETRFETFTRNLPGGVWRRVQEPDGRLTYTFFTGGSPGFPAVSPEAVLRDPNLLLDTIHPDDRPGMMASIQESSRTMSDWSREFRTVDQDGVVHWMHALAKPLRLADGRVAWDGITLDVTARKRSEQALRDSERRFRNAFNEAAEGMALIGPDGRWLRVNQSLAALLGAPPEDIAGTAVGRSVPRSHRRSLMRLWRMATRDPTRSVQAEIRIIGRKAEAVWVRIKAVPVRDDDDARLLYWVAHVQDISAQRATRELLVQARDQAEATARAKSDFLAMMSHEIRTPLAGMIGLARLLQEDSLPPAALRRAGRLESAGRLLLGLIDDILTLSKAEAGGLALTRTTFSPTGLVSEVIGLLSANAESRRLRLTMAVEPTVPAWLTGPAPAMRQVLFNLVGNAVKFTHAGNIAVHTEVEFAPSRSMDSQQDDPHQGRAGHLESTPEAAVTPVPAVPWLRFTVQDTGIGVAEEDRNRIFEVFGQGRAVRMDVTGQFAGAATGGVGLGLALCRRMVEAMQGRIGFDSTPGDGSRFWFSVPLSCPDPSDGPPDAWAAPEMSPAEDDGPGARTAPAGETEASVSRGAFLGRRVAVVDDDAINREVLEASLEFLGCTCRGFDSGRAVLDAAADPDGLVPDLVLMDLNMPGMAGTEAARALKAAGSAWAGVPIVGVTAGRGFAGRLDIDADDPLAAVLFKPVEIATLAETLAGSTAQADVQAAPGEAPPKAALPVLDQAVWQKRLAILGRERLKTRLTELFSLGRTMRAWAGGSGAMAAGDVEAAAHRIRGAAATLGARSLAAAAAELEDAIRGQDAGGRGSAAPARVPEHIRRPFAAAWDAAQAACQDSLAAAPGEAEQDGARPITTDPATPAPPERWDGMPS